MNRSTLNKEFPFDLLSTLVSLLSREKYQVSSVEQNTFQNVALKVNQANFAENHDNDHLKLLRWNNEIEASYASFSRNKSDAYFDESDGMIKKAASMLQLSLYFSFKKILEPTFARSEEFEKKTTMKIVESDITKLAIDVASIINSKKKKIESSDDGRGDLSDTNLKCCVDTLKFVSEVVRACKNLIRLRNQMENALSTGIARSKINDNSSVSQLQSRAMLNVYITFLTLCSNNKRMPSEKATVITKKLETMIMNISRHSSLVLFHAMHGNPNTASRNALGIFIRQLNGIPILVDMLVRPNPVPTTLSIVRHLHNLIGTMPDSFRQINAVLQKKFIGGGEEKFNRVQQEEPVCLVQILCASLVWTIRSNPSFPGTSSMDRRGDLAEEIWHVLFAIGVGNQFKTAFSDNNLDEQLNHKFSPKTDAILQLGILICDVLHMSNFDSRTYRCKLAAVHLLMDAPVIFGKFLFANNCVDPLVVILWLQLNAVLVEKQGGGSQDVVQLMPILVVLSNMAQGNVEFKQILKNKYVFPVMANSGLRVHENNVSNSSKNGTSSVSNRPMNPKDSPPGTLRNKLIRLMTWTDSNVKRCASEFLWILCDENADEFVVRTGFGNAVHTLGIKGLVSLPQNSTVQ